MVEQLCVAPAARADARRGAGHGAFVGLRVAIDAKDAGVVEAVLEAVRRTRAEEHVLFWSQHMSAARAFAHAAPDADVGLFRDTLDETAHQQLLADAVATGPAVPRHQDAVTPRFIAAARDRGLDVYVGYQTLAVQSDRLAMTADAGCWCRHRLAGRGARALDPARPPLDVSMRAMPTPTAERPSASDLDSRIVAARARRGRRFPGLTNLGEPSRPYESSR